MKTLEGQLTAQGMKVAIVVARLMNLSPASFERRYRLLERHGWDNEDITAVWSQEQFESPFGRRRSLQ